MPFPDTFGVVRFEGRKGCRSAMLSRSRSFGQPRDDLQGVMENPAKLVLHRDEGTMFPITASSCPSSSSRGERLAFYGPISYRRLTWLSFTQHNQVFLDKRSPRYRGMLQGRGITGADFEFRLQGSYDPVEYVCQYSESHLNFVSRWCEGGDLLLLRADGRCGEGDLHRTQISHTPIPRGHRHLFTPLRARDGAREGDRQLLCLPDELNPPERAPEGLQLQEAPWMYRGAPTWTRRDGGRSTPTGTTSGPPRRVTGLRRSRRRPSCAGRRSSRVRGRCPI